MSFKPMLAGKCEDVSKLAFPVMCSVKLDGVRALVIGGQVVSRNLKPIPNAWVQMMFSGLPEGTDGELIFGDPTHPDAYRNTVSAVMSEDGEPTQVGYHVFDNFTYSGGFNARFCAMVAGPDYYEKPNVNVFVVPHGEAKDADAVTAFETIALEQGYEGLMVRSPNGPYKQGRSTANEGYLLKVKRFEDAEAVILSCFELESNTNSATTSLTGHTERSSHKAGMKGMGVLGGFELRGLNGAYMDVEFRCGSGLSGSVSGTGQRFEYWKIRESLVGRIIKFKYFPTGSKEKPRFPIFLGFRDKGDM